MKNLIIVSLDCLRREAVGAYRRNFPSLLHKEIPIFRFRGMYRFRPFFESLLDRILKLIFVPSTPNIDHIATEGVLFTQAVSQAPYTPASHASIFTGLNPFSHGIRQFVGFKLSSKALTIAERLKTSGFNTAGFIGSNALGGFYDLDRGFDIYDFHSRLSSCQVDDLKVFRRGHSEVTSRALEWLANVDSRFFLFVHYFDIHETDESISYQPFFQIMKIRKIDNDIGKIVRLLREKNLYDETILVLVSDHGNDFGIHEPGHREYLYDTTLLVPLIIKGDKSIAGARIEQQVRLIDIYPTVLELLNSPVDNPPPYKKIEGRSLLPLCRGETRLDLPAYSETCLRYSDDPADVAEKSFMSLRFPGWKIVVDRNTKIPLLFDLKNDPYEREDVSLLNKDRANVMMDKLTEFLRPDAEANADMDEHEISRVKESLKALGYL